MKRPAAVTYTAGRASSPAFTTSNIYASVQPLRAEEMALLPEARRQTAAYLIFTDTEIRAAKEGVGQQADRIVLNGDDFEIFSVERWRNNVISHYKATAVKIQ